MSSITYIERQHFEKLFGMPSGYVLDFTNQSFQEFILDVSGKDIYHEKYSQKGNSKANRLRAFLLLEPDAVVANVLEGLLALVNQSEVNASDFRDCQVIVNRLKRSGLVLDTSPLQDHSAPTTEVLLKSIRLSLGRDEPQEVIDRLHTLTVIRSRQLCERHQIFFDRKEPLHSLFGKYVKHLVNAGIVQSKTAERLLKSNIKILDDFNDTRNNQSLAHANDLLSREESNLILNQITALFRFVHSIEEIHYSHIQGATSPSSDETIETESEVADDEGSIEYQDAEYEDEDDFCSYCYLDMFPGQQCPNCSQFNP